MQVSDVLSFRMIRSVAFACACMFPLATSAQDAPVSMDPNQLTAQIEEQLSAFEESVVALENSALPEGSEAAVREALARLKGASSSEAKQAIEQAVQSAARGWVSADRAAQAAPPVEGRVVEQREGDVPKPVAPKDETFVENGNEAPISPENGAEDHDGVDQERVPQNTTGEIQRVSRFADLRLPTADGEPDRVLTLPGATILSRTSQEEQPPFTVLYNHGTAAVGDQLYLAVGKRRELADGWVELDKTEEWRSMLVMEYAPRANRERVLFFNDAKDVQEVLRSHFSGPEDARTLYRSVREDQFDNAKIVAIEPEKTVAGDERPYLMPVLNFEKNRFDDLAETPVFLLELGAVNLQSQSRTEEDVVNQPKVSVNEAEAVKDFKLGMVFVVDATQSMGPYIEEVKRFLMRVRNRASDMAPGRVEFGLMGYRDNTSVNSEIGYVTEYFLPLGTGSGNDFDRAVSQIQASRASTRNWREDAFAGLSDALDKTNWSEYDARYVVLVTDAGPRAFNDTLARDPQMGARSIGRAVQRKGIALTIMHMKTEAGVKDHKTAMAQYNQVSDAIGSAAPSYWTLSGQTPEHFAESMNKVGSQLLQRVGELFKGEPIPEPVSLPDDVILGDLMGPARITSKEEASRVADVFDQQLFAFQQEYLGKLEQGEAPDFYRAWVSDRDLVNPAISSMSVKVLMTRDQMSDLSARLGDIVRQLDTKDTGTRDAFRAMADLSGVATYDPTLPVAQLLPEYLAELPYGSRFMTMTADVWAGLGGQQQDEILNEVRDRVRLLESINTTQAGWLKLPGRGSNDALYPLALNDLP